MGPRRDMRIKISGPAGCLKCHRTVLQATSMRTHLSWCKLKFRGNVREKIAKRFFRGLGWKVLSFDPSRAYDYIIRIGEDVWHVNVKKPENPEQMRFLSGYPRPALLFVVSRNELYWAPLFRMNNYGNGSKNLGRPPFVGDRLN